MEEYQKQSSYPALPSPRGGFGVLRFFRGLGTPLIVLIILTLLLTVNKGSTSSAEVEKALAEQPTVLSQAQAQQEPIDLKGAPELTAKAALVYNTDSGQLVFQKNISEPMPVASLTKLTTALLASRTLSPEQVITVQEQSLRGLVNPRLGLVAGEKIKVSHLVEGMLVGSNNDAAEVLANAIGGGDRQKAILMMNSLASNIGLKNTHYANPTGYDDKEAYSTAEDVLSVIFELKRTPWLTTLLSESRGQVASEDGKQRHYFTTTNQLLRSNLGVTGGKTGYTDEAKGSLAVFATSPAGHEFIAIVLGSENREVEMTELLKWTFDNYKF